MKVLGEHKSQISSVRVDWAYALALSSRVSEPSSQHDASNTGKAEHEVSMLSNYKQYKIPSMFM